MPLGTLDRTPPPFFRQGPSAFTRLVFFASLALCMMAADTRYSLTDPLRVVVATVLNPIERLLLTPIDGLRAAGAYFGGISDAQATAQRAQAQLAAQAQRVLLNDSLQQENNRLRALLELRARQTTAARPAEVLYDAPDPYTRKVIINQGSAQGIERSSPVIDERGVLGQVTRVYPMTAEVTLLSDRDAAIAVLNTRSQQRGVAHGDPSIAGMELRYTAANADVLPGDTLITTGLDGVFPGGYPVARVTKVDRRADSAFARISLAPMAPMDAIRQVLVLTPVGKSLPASPGISPARDDKALPLGGAVGGARRR